MKTGNRSLRQVVLPIRVGIDPMERLLVANFKGDPEFEGFELQVFDDPINGKGMRVLRYRKDGKVDVYWQHGVHVDRSTFTVGAGIGDFAETAIEPARFEITKSSLDLQVAFTDAQGRKVELPASGSIEVEGMTVVVDRDGIVTRISTGQEPCRVEIDFFPGFPNLLDLASGGSAAGRWSIRIAGVSITGGSYNASREGDRVAIELDVTEQWKPSGLPLSMDIFTRVVSMFRTWPATYRWRGVVELGVEPVMSGVWERKGRLLPNVS